MYGRLYWASALNRPSKFESQKFCRGIYERTIIDMTNNKNAMPVFLTDDIHAFELVHSAKYRQ